MLKQVLENNIVVVDKVLNWQEGIKTAASPLKKGEFVSQAYIDAMIKNVIDNGPYVVIMPGIAIPHSRPEDGVLKTGMSLLKLSKDVIFPENKKVRLIIPLAANNSEKHIKLISELTEFLMEEKLVEKLFLAKSKKEVLNCIW